MKNLTVIIFTFLFISLSLSVSGQNFSTKAKQPTRTSPKTQVVTKHNSGRSVQYMNPKKLKEGRNLMILSKTKLEVIKKRGKVISVKKVDSRGRAGSNLLTSIPTNQKFVCTGSLCFCFGDNDCNNMFTSNVCKDCIDCAGCVGDGCYCEKN